MINQNSTVFGIMWIQEKFLLQNLGVTEVLFLLESGGHFYLTHFDFKLMTYDSGVLGAKFSSG